MFPATISLHTFGRLQVKCGLVPLMISISIFSPETPSQPLHCILGLPRHLRRLEKHFGVFVFHFIHHVEVRGFGGIGYGLKLHFLPNLLLIWVPFYICVSKMTWCDSLSSVLHASSFLCSLCNESLHLPRYWYLTSLEFYSFDLDIHNIPRLQTDVLRQQYLNKDLH